MSQVDELPSALADFVEVCIDLPQIGEMECQIVWICLAVGVAQSTGDSGIGKELRIVAERGKASCDST